MRGLKALLSSPKAETRSVTLLPPVLMACLSGTGLTLLFGAWTATSAWSFPLFLLSLVLLVYLPGKAIIDLLPVRMGSLEDLSLSLAVGMAAATLLYIASSLLGGPYLLHLWVIAAVVSFFCRRLKRGWHLTFTTAESKAATIVGGIVLLALIRPIASPLFYRSFALLPEGAMTFAILKDTAFQLALTNELVHGVGSPQVPFLAGLPLRYHYGMNLLGALFCQFSGLSTLDLVVRFLPVFFLFQTTLAMFCLSRAWLQSTAWAGFTTLLMVFGEDFSSLPAAIAARLYPQNHTSLDFFGVPTTHAFYETNPLLPALGLFFCALLCMTRYSTERSRTWLLVAGFLFASLLEYKIFIFAHALAALAAAGALCYWRRRDKSLMKVLLAALLFTIPLIAYSYRWLGEGPGTNASLGFSLWPHLPFTVGGFGLPDLSFNSQTGQHGLNAPDGVGGLLATLGVAVPVYLIGSLGLRFIGIPSLLKELFRPCSGLPIRAYVALFAALGPLVTLTWTVYDKGYPAQMQVDNSFWFFVQSKYVAWLFAVEVIRRYLSGKPRLWQTLVVAFLLELSVATTVLQTVSFLPQQLPELDSSTTQVLAFLGQACTRGEVVLSSKDLAIPLVTMTKCRVPVSTGIWETHFAGPSEVQQRLADRDGFWTDWRQGELRKDILERYNVVYLAVNKAEGDARPAGATGEGRGLPAQACLVPRFENAGFLVYEVRCTANQP